MYQSTKQTIQGFDAQYFLHREKKSYNSDSYDHNK